MSTCFNNSKPLGFKHSRVRQENKCIICKSLGDLGGVLEQFKLKPILNHTEFYTNFKRGVKMEQKSI